MEVKRTSLDLFDLLSKSHFWSKELIQEKWNEESTIRLSDTEWFILHLLNLKTCTAADISKQAAITRQATHKAIRKLEMIELVKSSFPKNNKRMKVVTLTSLGQECYIKYKNLRISLENQMKESIGKEQFDTLKNILASKWLAE